MKEIRIVVVEPMYQINLGYIARVAKNFGIGSISLVNPRCSYRGREAIKYSKHAKELLEKAAVFSSVKKATRGTFVVGTTALWRKTGEAFHNVYDPGTLLKMIRRNGIESISILIGRDDTGLTKEELSGCDASVFIPTNKEYPALNISHALAIILYAFSDCITGIDNEMGLNAAGRVDTERISKLFKILVSKRKDIRNRRAVTMAFDHVIRRAYPTKKEIGALSVALSPNGQSQTNAKRRMRHMGGRHRR